MSKAILFSAFAQRKFAVNGLSATTSVLGRSHQFDFDGHQITLTLPFKSRDDAEDWEVETRRTSWTSTDPENPDTTINEVYRVELRTDIKETLSINETALSDPYKTRNATPKETKELNSVASEYTQRLVGAWEHWQSVVRWVAGPRSIGVSHSTFGTDQYGQRGAVIFNSIDNRKIWSLPYTVTIQRAHPIDTTKWDLLQEVLLSGQIIPVWSEFLSEAHARLGSYDYRGAIASAAVACETVARSIFWLSAPQVANQAVREMIDRTPAQSIIGKWQEIAGPAPSGKWSLNRVHRLFDLRNRLMHLGQSSADPTEVRHLLTAATDFVCEADGVFIERTGSIDWPSKYRKSSSIR